MQKKSILKFLLYVYGLSIALLITIIALDFNSSILSDFRAYFNDICSIEMELTLAANIFFFFSSAWKIYKTRQQIKAMDDRKAQNFQEIKDR
jgi:hypothetical protein